VYSWHQKWSGRRVLFVQNKLPPFCGSGLSGIGYIHLYTFRVFEAFLEHVFVKKTCSKRARNCAQTGVVFGPSLRGFRGGLSDLSGALIPVSNLPSRRGVYPPPDASCLTNPDLPDTHLEVAAHLATHSALRLYLVPALELFHPVEPVPRPSRPPRDPSGRTLMVLDPELYPPGRAFWRLPYPDDPIAKQEDDPTSTHS
jgi:hypothetical protein